MLDDLRAKMPSNSPAVCSGEIREEIGNLGIKPFSRHIATDSTPRSIPLRRNAHLAHQLQELAAAAADIEHAVAIGKERAVEFFGLTDLRFRAAETKRETGVVDIERPRGCRGMRGGCLRRSRWRRQAAVEQTADEGG